MPNKITTYSATMLQDYQDCQRRFEYKYLLSQSWPGLVSEPIKTYEEHLARGKQFHYLVHQFFSGLPLDTIQKMDQDTKVMSWFEIFLNYINTFEFKVTFSEFRLHTKLNTYNLTAIYDLIALDINDSLMIFDWKTSSREPRRGYFVSRMQSMLYPFILWNNKEEFTHYSDKHSPRKISMVYWFPEFPEIPISIDYTSDDHAVAKENLSALLSELSSKTDNSEYMLTKKEFLCKYCQYRSLCERGISAGNILEENDLDSSPDDFTIDFDSISSIGPDI